VMPAFRVIDLESTLSEVRSKDECYINAQNIVCMRREPIAQPDC
jgi:hypothetical protein